MTLGQFHLMRVMLRDPHHAPAASLGPAAESAAAKNTSIISLQQVRGHVQEQVQAASAELFQRVKALRTDGHQTKETLTKDLEATQKQLQSTTSELESIRDELKATKDVVNLLQKAVEELQQKTKQNVAAAVKTATLTARTGTKPSSTVQEFLRILIHALTVRISLRPSPVHPMEPTFTKTSAFNMMLTKS